MEQAFEEEIRDRYFSELNIVRLKEKASEWAGWYPAIEKVLLFKENPIEGEESKYVLVAVIPAIENFLRIKREYTKEEKNVQSDKKLSQKTVLARIEKLRIQKKEKLEALSNEELMAIRACEWSSTDCLHIETSLRKKVYEHNPQEAVLGQWMWLNVPTSKIDEADISDMIKPDSEMVLYEKFHEDQTPQGRKELPETGSDLPFNVSSDFRSITKDGKKYSLTTKQTGAIKVLCEAYLNGTPEISESHILERAGSKSERSGALKDLFKRNKEAFDNLIVPGKRRGLYGLKT